MTSRLVIALAFVARVAAADPLLDGLDTRDPGALSTSIAAIENAPAGPDALYAAARACEDRLHDPARALALYERIVRELPDARVALAATRRAVALRAEIGEHGEHADRARRLAALIASSEVGDAASLAAVTQLATEPWPGAPDAALFRAELLRRLERHAEAQAAYADVVQRWSSSPQAQIAIRGGAGNAIEAHDWALAMQLARSLTINGPADVVLRDDLFASVRTGKLRARLYGAAWIFLVGAIAGLVLSLGEAVLRARRRPSLVPPSEVWFLAPFGGLLVAIAYGMAMPIAPSVAVLTLGTLAMAWASGAALDLVRSSHRPLRARAVAHAIACALAALSLGYISVARAGLLDTIVETARYGPGT